MDIGCNRLENAVKPQLAFCVFLACSGCNRLENAVKPQPLRWYNAKPYDCNRLENAVKPQRNGTVLDANAEL